MADIIDLQPFHIGTPANGVNLYQVPNASMEVLEDIINATWNLALQKSTEVSTKVADATNPTGMLDPDTAPEAIAGSSGVPTITAPLVDIPASVTVDDIYDQWATEYIEVATWLTAQFTTFISTYFPGENAAYTAMEDYLQAAIANPEVGMPQATADQIWTDDRDRIIKDGARASAEALAAFAAKGFALPPGAAASAVLQIEQQTQDKVSESSRKVAAMSVDLMKFNVESLLKLRDICMKDAVDYVKALASAPEMASKLSNIGYDAQSKLISSAAAFYNADANAKDIMTKAGQYNNTIAFEASKANQASELQMTELNLKAMLSDIGSIAQQATALFNNLHVSATMQAGGTTVATQAEAF